MPGSTTGEPIRKWSFFTTRDGRYEIHSRVAGVSIGDRQDVVAALTPDEQLRLVREPTNPHDPNAVLVQRQDGGVLGYLPRDLAAWAAPWIDWHGGAVPAWVTEVLGGTQFARTLGAEIGFWVGQSNHVRGE